MGASAPRLTYCTNVHPAPDLARQLATLEAHVAPVAAAARAAGRAFGLGGWWPASLVDELHGAPEAAAALAAAMASASAPLWTLNVFPHGDFHQDVVKAAVYSPGDAPADERKMARNLARAASALAAVEERTGVRCVLALEPEPDCLLETAAQAADFLERWLFEEGAWTTVATDALRRHLGVCVDLCHLAVLEEDPLAALGDLRQRGIEVPKIQVSSCLEVRSPEGLEQLLAFEEPRYLHQTRAASGLRALDLDGVRARRAEFAAAGRVRTHYHVPLDWDSDGAFGSTQREVRRVLTALAASPEPAPLLEVETYTWSVLGDAFGAAPLHERIQRELDWVAAAWKN